MKTPVSETSRLSNVHIGARIRAARYKAGCTARDLAAKIGYATEKPVLHMESGMRMVSAADVAAIAIALNCTVRSLFPKGSVR